MQVFKCIGEAFEISRFKKLTQASLDLGRLTERRVARSVLLKVSGDRIAVVILRHEGIHFLVGHVVDRGYEVAHAITIDGVSKPDLRLYLVAFGDGNLSHVVAEPAILSVLPVAPRQRGAQPRLHARVSGSSLPVAHHYLAAQTQARHNIPELAVAVCAWVQVHKVHINGLPGNILVEL